MLKIMLLAFVGILGSAYALYRAITRVPQPFFVPAPAEKPGVDAGELEAPELAP